MDESAIKHTSQLAIEWYQIESLPDKEKHKLLHDNNHECLKQALLLEELSHTSIDDHTLDSKEAVKLDKKLDLLLGLLASVIQKQQQSTQTTQVTLGSHTLQWHQDEASGIMQADLLQVQLYIHPMSVIPLKLYGQISDISSGMVTFDISNLLAAHQDMLEKYIFLNHRRAIAAERKPQAVSH